MGNALEDILLMDYQGGENVLGQYRPKPEPRKFTVGGQEYMVIEDPEELERLRNIGAKKIWEMSEGKRWQAAKNLGKLGGNFLLDFIPGVGDVKSAQEAITGTQPMLEGVPGVESKLTIPERIAAGIGALPFMPSLAGALKKVPDIGPMVKSDITAEKTPKAEGGIVLNDYRTKDHINSTLNEDQFGKIKEYKELWVTTEGGKGIREWRDGHSEYDHIKNPIARLRVTIRGDNPTFGYALFLEEIQQPSQSNKALMPSNLRNRGYEIAIQRLVDWANKQNVDVLVVPNAELIHVGMGWEKGDLSQVYDKVVPSKLTKLLGEPQINDYGGRIKLKYWEIP